MSEKKKDVNYPFVLQVLAEYGRDKLESGQKNGLQNYLFAIFGSHSTKNTDKLLFNLFEHPEISSPEIARGFLDFLSFYYCRYTVTSEREAALLKPYLKNFLKHSHWRAISNTNKDSEFFNKIYKEEKANLSESASTKDLVELINKADRIKDLEIINKILNDFHSAKRGTSQTIDLSIVREEVQKFISTKKYGNPFNEPDSGGKVLRILELCEMKPEFIDANYMGIMSNKPVLEKTNWGSHTKSGVDPKNTRKAFTSISFHWAKTLIMDTYSDEQRKTLMDRVFYSDVKDGTVKQNYYSPPVQSKLFLQTLIEFVQSQKTDLKTLSLLTPLIQDFFKRHKADGDYKKLNAPDVSKMPTTPGADASVYWMLNFISANSDALKEHCSISADTVLQSLIQIEQKNLKKLMPKKKEGVPVAKPRVNKI